MVFLRLFVLVPVFLVYPATIVFCFLVFQWFSVVSFIVHLKVPALFVLPSNLKCVCVCICKKLCIAFYV